MPCSAISPLSRPHVAVLCSFLLLFLAGCGGDDEGSGFPGAGGEQTAAVEIVQVQQGTLPLQQRLSGTVQARNQVTVIPEVAGRIEEVYVDNGDVVQPGTALVRINARQQTEQLTQAEANLRIQRAAAEQAQARLRELEVELNTTETLAAAEHASPLELERLRAQVAGARADHNRAIAQVEQAESSVQEARQNVAETTVRAPVGGQVGRRNAEVGMNVGTSSELFVVGDLSQMSVRVNLTERMLSFIETGQRALVWPGSQDSPPIEAEVSRISPFLQAGSFSTEARIDIDNNDGRLRSGMYVDVDILYGETETATLVPNSALHEDPRSGRMGVFVASEVDTMVRPVSSDQDRSDAISEPKPLEYREVDVLAQGRSSTGVLGLQAGEWVVAVGQGLLSSDAEELQARTRPVEWDYLFELQELQSHDLLRQFMDKQQQQAQLRSQ